ncbi:MAG: leucyl/phenylalanyl-tRNA--protein transferase [Acidobacteriota bacterium]
MPDHRSAAHAVPVLGRLDEAIVADVALPLTPALLASAYRLGFFPMAMDEGQIRWFSPDPRGILPLDAFRVPRRLRRVIRSRRFSVTVNCAFGEVIAGCAEHREDGTWISPEIVDAYVRLHREGLAHSVEVWHGTGLAGGLYGVSLGGAFFGESMFHRATDASKVALHALVARLVDRRYVLLDTQWLTPFLETFGGIEVPRETYLTLLGRALRLERRFDDRTGA